MISIQFYALPNEIFDTVVKWKNDFGLYLVTMKMLNEIRAFEFQEIDNLSQSTVKFDEIHCLFLGLNAPKITVKTSYEFLVKNKDFLTIDIGKLNANGLTESFFSGITENEDVLKLWKSLARQLKKSTITGLWAVNTELGGKHFYKNSRYTVGACELSRQGTKLLTDGSFVYCSVDEPQDSN